MDKHQYLNIASDYRDFRDRREFLRSATTPAIEEALQQAELEHGGHARIYGREGGGVIVVHLADDGTTAEHHFEPHEYADACNHLHEFIRPDFQRTKKGESNR